MILYLVKLVVDEVSAGTQSSGANASFDKIGLLVLAMGVMALISSLVGVIGTYVQEMQRQLVADDMQNRMHAKSVEIDLEFFENSDYYDTLHRAQEEGTTRPAAIVEHGIGVLRSGLSLTLIAGLVLTLHWGVGLVLLGACVPGALVQLRFSEKLYSWKKSITTTERHAWYSHLLLSGADAAKELRLLGFGELFSSRFSALRESIRLERFVILRGRALAILATQTLATVGVYGSYGFIAFRTFSGLLTVGDLVLYYQLFRYSQELLTDLLRNAAALYEDDLYLLNLFEFLDLKRSVLEPERPHFIPPGREGAICFENISFSYPGTSRDVLRNLSFEITPGECVAFVGKNGSGKSTLVKLLTRLYDPTGGSILVGGVDVRNLETKTLRRQLSVVFQDSMKYQLTARENIWLGNLELDRNDSRIEVAARLAGVEPTLLQLPNGVDSVLGRWFDEGHELSIGEWQKIALARAYLRDAHILVMDEPTSSMDARAEHEIFERFHDLAKERTSILISHRLSTVKMCDRIYMLDEGRIQEAGTHDELHRHGGAYASLFDAQARHYQ